MTTVQLNSIPTETLIRHNPMTGAFQAASVKFMHPGATAESSPVGFADAANSEVIQAIFDATLVDALAEIEVLRSQAVDLGALQIHVATLQAENADLQAQLEELQNPVQPVGDWGAFRLAIATSPAYLRIAATAPVQNTLLVDAIRSATFSEVPALWNAMAAIASPTPEEATELNDLATQAGVPFALNSQGLMAP